MTRRGRMRPSPRPTIDLARPAFGQSPFEPSKGAKRSTTKVALVREPSEDATVRAIAKVLLSGARRGDPESYTTESQMLAHLLRPYGIRLQATQMAVSLARTQGGYMRGTAHLPNARLAGAHATMTAEIHQVRDTEIYFRAAYLANAAKRMQESLDAGATQAEALKRERVFYSAHEKARRGRLTAVAQVQHAAKLFGAPDENGTLVGWYLNPLLNNDPECIAANGHNFYAEQGTLIGLPGSVHPQCGCYAGTPHWGAGMVDDAFKNVSRLPVKQPKFKLRQTG